MRSPLSVQSLIPVLSAAQSRSWFAPLVLPVLPTGGSQARSWRQGRLSILWGCGAPGAAGDFEVHSKHTAAITVAAGGTQGLPLPRDSTALGALSLRAALAPWCSHVPGVPQPFTSINPPRVLSSYSFRASMLQSSPHRQVTDWIRSPG